MTVGPRGAQGATGGGEQASEESDLKTDIERESTFKSHLDEEAAAAVDQPSHVARTAASARAANLAGTVGGSSSSNLMAKTMSGERAQAGERTRRTSLHKQPSSKAAHVEELSSGQASALRAAHLLRAAANRRQTMKQAPKYIAATGEAVPSGPAVTVEELHAEAKRVQAWVGELVHGAEERMAKTVAEAVEQQVPHRPPLPRAAIVAVKTARRSPHPNACV